MSYFVTFDKAYNNRYIFDLFIGAGAVKFPCIVDTACSTTLVPINIAKRYGKPTKHKQKVIVGGNIYEAVLYRLDNVNMGNLIIERLSVLAADYKGNLKERALLGQNVLNNLKFSVSRNALKMEFELDLWDIVKHKKYPFTMFFNQNGSNPVYDEDLFVDD